MLVVFVMTMFSFKKPRLGLSGHYPHTSFIAIIIVSTKKRGHSIRSHSTSAVVQTSRNFFSWMKKDNEKSRRGLSSSIIHLYYSLPSSFQPRNEVTRSDLTPQVQSCKLPRTFSLRFIFRTIQIPTFDVLKMLKNVDTL